MTEDPAVQVIVEQIKSPIGRPASQRATLVPSQILDAVMAMLQKLSEIEILRRSCDCNSEGIIRV